MRVVIIGTGAMGCLFGARLHGLCEVVLYNRNQKSVASINGHGIRVTELDGKQHQFPITAVSTLEHFDQWAELVLICTKSGATTAVAPLIAHILQPEGYVLTLQNGLGNLEQLQEAVGPSRVLAGVTSQAATVLAPGSIRHAGEGPTYLGGPHDAAFLSLLVQTFSRAGIPAFAHQDVESLIWGKLVINVGINALTALLRVPNGTLADYPVPRQLVQQLVEEAAAVAHAAGIQLPYADPMAQVLDVCHKTANNRASMLQDILRGVLTEIEVINGAIVQKGEALGVATPANCMITNLVRALEETSAQRIE